MKFQVIGVNHNSAPLDVRERLAVPEAQLPVAIEELVKQPGVDEGMVLSTCNRVEVITSTQPARPICASFWAAILGFQDGSHSHIYEFSQREAVRHVFRVASSLDSMVVGEPQILGQVKEAYAVARGLGRCAFGAGSSAVASVRRGQAGAHQRPRSAARRFHRVSRGATGGEDFRQR